MPIADYTSEAKTDLRQIVEYIARDDLGAALKWVDEIEGACDLLATRPEIGERVRSKRFGETRRHVVGKYLIYYRPADDGIIVCRIVHGARDQRRLV